MVLALAAVTVVPAAPTITSPGRGRTDLHDTTARRRLIRHQAVGP